ncbi:MAG: DMT family transporter [Methylophilaceae bacterium]|jgi:drug/metabolite transporter (DMT)-like permease|nr:DMT family transporter [Methylophilaceae bacterium]
MFRIHKGVQWMLISTVCFSIMGACVKFGGGYFSPYELVFYRALISLIVITVIMKLTKVKFSSNYPQLHIARSIVGSISLLLFFYAICYLPLSTAMTLNYTSPLFVGLLMPFILKRKVKNWLFLAILVGFIGVFFTLKPTFDNQNYLAGFVGLISGFGAAMAYLFVTQLAQLKEPDIRTVFYFTLISTIGAGLISLLDGFHKPRIEDLFFLFLLGISATVAQLAITRAYRVGNTLGNAGLSYLAIVFSTIIGVFYFKEIIGWNGFVGITLIIISGLLASRR